MRVIIQRVTMSEGCRSDAILAFEDVTELTLENLEQAAGGELQRRGLAIHGEPKQQDGGLRYHLRSTDDGDGWFMWVVS